MPSILESLGTALSGKLGEKLNLSGGTLTGPLVVPEPTASNHVATSNQVVTLEAAIGSYADFVSSSADITIGVQDTAANILARTEDDWGTIALATDTNALYVWDGALWSLSSEATVQADSLAAGLTYQVSGDTEANIRLREGDATGTIMFGTDTGAFYIFDGTSWQQYNPDY
jgi:hypothetical protein